MSSSKSTELRTIELSVNSDISIQYKDTKFLCSKIVLQHYSKVWKIAIDGDDDAEEISLTEDIYLAEHLKSVLEYIHCPVFMNDRKNIIQIDKPAFYYYIAHKYDISAVISTCKELITEDIKDTDKKLPGTNLYACWGKTINWIYMLDLIGVSANLDLFGKRLPELGLWNKYVDSRGYCLFIVAFENLNQNTRNGIMKYYMMRIK
jgi:hypothetical protein